MKSWSSPALPDLPGESGPLHLFDTASDALREVRPEGPARMYVCGITPYDATHLGHAATYVTFDLANRALRAAGHAVAYVQNTTDVDDPLLERAARDGVDWRELAASEIRLFHEDMTALRVLPPDHYVGVVETMPQHVATVTALLDSGAAYPLEVDAAEAATDGVRDIYLDLSKQPSFGEVSHWSREQMMSVFAERGGDPDRSGKRDPLDPLLWRGARKGEPSWEGGEIGGGRPGWHIECTTIALNLLHDGFDIQGGGTDLIFPHHEMSAVQAAALTGRTPFAQLYAHQGMVGYDGEKMSKSKGNLVRVSDLRRDGVDPMAIRLVLLAQHFRTDWEFTDALLKQAAERLERWRAVVASGRGADAAPVVAAVRAHLADDLHSERALDVIDDWAARSLDAPENGAAVAEVRDAVDALLGVRL
ncbi:cysteine--1-D-myo-inosityl 2-amino-2-deoxy-alpha-D-glucopyranoside ligase [Luteipulveratus sp. YIM 133132]|uniref:cysteine--1-D-myo-inosityl 2-amino-2-deoxy-alpha-D-glucopyranoside ligase n=1 Tax=Luteipulveratus flavus TaxID=3031728 RepID=UPI0023B1191E|nr:cysteine--1-D-myo-inosityl 2-amino-2-deoxy-alpha-D-glucopyranoside ligase [Luteipulveratus sp. YIM 133132]MDE9366520.1 cysteine--1-D-myo-inosityl 2-amino-2-deoxy-alpha-D-glucopyranoside ligase [Luteipulveratus sp. YIM 133132]